MFSHIPYINQSPYNSTHYLDNRMQEAFLPKVTQNLMIAKDIIAYVKTAVPFSHNDQSRNAHLTSHLSAEEFVQMYENLDKTYLEYKDFTDLNDVNEDWKMLANSVEGIKIGACLDFSIVGFAYGMEKLHLKQVEIFEIVKGDHSFLVIGRDPQSKPHDYKNWGNSSVVCDPWAEICYPSNEISSKLYDYKGTYLANNRYLPIKEPFDPATQHFSLVTSSFQPLELED